MSQGVADGGTQVGLRLQLMGGFQATWGCETVELGPSSAELVCLLALRRRRATPFCSSRVTVAREDGVESDGESSHRNLASA